MLQSLSIENYAIIAKVDIHFDDSLNIITGETGAGKSILLGALGLIMGQRADSKVLFDNESKCIVEAIFTHFPKSVNKLLKQNDLDQTEELIIRREIVPSGRSRAFVNDTPTNLGVLQQLSLALVDLNQQFRIVEIQDRTFQLNIIDALAKNDTKVEAYKTLYKAYKNKTTELKEIQNMESAQLKELDFMKFQFQELSEAGLDGLNQAEMEGETQLLDKAEDIATLMEETKYKLVESETNLRDQLQDLAKKWSGYAEVDPQINQGAIQLEDLLTKVDEIYHDSDQISGKTDGDPGRLMELRERLDKVYSLQKKHGVHEVSDLLAIASSLEGKLSSIENRGETIALLEQEISVLEKELWGKADELTTRRKKVFSKFQKEVNGRLNDLSMGSAEIKISHLREEVLRSDGADTIDILFKANKGTDFQPIRKVASGGETSRLMLSIKASVANAMALPTMIFDEIDTGVSGDVAGKMGNILKDLASKHQLICITHSPQVSARAVKHFFVHKEETKSRTLTHVKVLDKEERIIEIAKMLSGNPPSTFALDNAKDLLSI